MGPWPGGAVEASGPRDLASLSAGASGRTREDFYPAQPEGHAQGATGVQGQRCERESPFGGPIAHGFLTLSLLPKLSAQTSTAGDFVPVGFGNAVNYGSDKLRFLSPVPSGSKVHARMRLAEVTAVPKGTRVVQEVAVHVVGSDRPAILYSMITLYQPKRG